MVLHKDQISYIRCLMVLFKKLWRLNNVESKYTLWYVLNRFCKIHFSKESNKIWLNLSKHNVELYNLTEQHGYLTKVWKKVLQESSYPTKGRASDAHPETCYWRTNPPTNLDMGRTPSLPTSPPLPKSLWASWRTARLLKLFPVYFVWKTSFFNKFGLYKYFWNLIKKASEVKETGWQSLTTWVRCLQDGLIRC